jgi:glycosyltransferase involved in cell wall biosynthesis
MTALRAQPSPAHTDGSVELSIIIPAFNEEQRLPKTLKHICHYLRCRNIRAEVLVVDDGSTDDTAKLVSASKSGFSELRLVSNGRNRGKGFSVRHGMLEARGEFALFTDADLSTPIAELEKLLAVLRDGYDVAIGSRAMDRKLIEVHQSALRERAGIIFNGFVRHMTGLPFQDTQCGFKAFRRERMHAVFEQQRTDGFGFDPEVLFLAQRKGLRIAEIPVRWAHDPATKVHMVRDSLGMFLDLFAIRWNEAIGRYSKLRGG